MLFLTHYKKQPSL